MTEKEVTVDLKKVLRERMLSLLQKPSDSTSENSGNNAPAKSNDLILTAFSSFLNEKRKQVNVDNPINSISSDPTTHVNIDSFTSSAIDKKSSPSSKRSTEKSNANQQNVPLKPNDCDEKYHSSYSLRSDPDRERKRISKKHRKESSKTQSSELKSSLTNSVGENSIKSKNHPRKKSSKSLRHRSRSRDRPKKTKSRKKSRSRSKDGSPRRSCSSSRKDERRRDSNIYDDIGVDPDNLEKFFCKELSSNKRSRSRSPRRRTYHYTFKRDPSPPTPREYLALKRRRFEEASRYFEIATKPINSGKQARIRSDGQLVGTRHNSGKKSLKELTDYCRQIAERRLEQERLLADGDKTAEDSDGEITATNPSHSTNAIRLKIRDGRELKAKSAVEQLQSMYPVSSGMDHMGREKDNTKLPVEQLNPAFHALIQRRLEAVAVLAKNPNDYAALLTIEECDNKIANWAATGKDAPLDAKLTAPPLHPAAVATASSAVVQGPQLPDSAFAHIPAQAIPDEHLMVAHPGYLQMIAQSKLEIGKKLLEKQGWREGMGLGKDLGGNVEPILPDVKLDRKGLSTEIELEQRPLIAKILASNGKHPVSVLQEICSQRRWGAPNFDLVEVMGPPHRQSFIMSVKVRDIVYQPTSASPTKKEAKALAATLCLQSLGLWKASNSDASKT